MTLYQTKRTLDLQESGFYSAQSGVIKLKMPECMHIQEHNGARDLQRCEPAVKLLNPNWEGFGNVSKCTEINMQSVSHVKWTKYRERTKNTITSGNFSVCSG